MQKIYHPKRGIVMTGDQTIIDEILAEGGRLINSVRDIKEPEDDLIGGIIVEKSPAEPENMEKIPAPVMRPHRRGK